MKKSIQALRIWERIEDVCIGWDGQEYVRPPINFVVDIAERVGVPLEDRPLRGHAAWDGKALSKQLKPDVILHDIGHYQMSAPFRRTQNEFGLGAGNESYTHVVRTLDSKKTLEEEELASLMGILYEWMAGCNILYSLSLQNWVYGVEYGKVQYNGMVERTHALAVIERLITDGYIVYTPTRVGPNFTPTYAARQTPDDPQHIVEQTEVSVWDEPIRQVDDNVTA